MKGCFAQPAWPFGQYLFMNLTWPTATRSSLVLGAVYQSCTGWTGPCFWVDIDAEGPVRVGVSVGAGVGVNVEIDVKVDVGAGVWFGGGTEVGLVGGGVTGIGSTREEEG